uniref:Transposase IS66 C-terminal domain-containing protein n=1 Tax=Serratia proteamaculans (strain 568) TaxID=399741 RepID=A8G8N7_SERP5
MAMTGAQEQAFNAASDGVDPYAYLKDVLACLPMQWASEIDQLLPHNWRLPKLG